MLVPRPSLPTQRFGQLISDSTFLCSRLGPTLVGVVCDYAATIDPLTWLPGMPNTRELTPEELSPYAQAGTRTDQNGRMCGDTGESARRRTGSRH